MNSYNLISICKVAVKPFSALVEAPTLCNNIWCSTLSKALLISKSTQAVNFLSSIPLRNASVNLLVNLSQSIYLINPVEKTKHTNSLETNPFIHLLAADCHRFKYLKFGYLFESRFKKAKE